MREGAGWRNMSLNVMRGVCYIYTTKEQTKACSLFLRSAVYAAGLSARAFLFFTVPPPALVGAFESNEKGRLRALGRTNSVHHDVFFHGASFPLGYKPSRMHCMGARLRITVKGGLFLYAVGGEKWKN